MCWIHLIIVKVSKKLGTLCKFLIRRNEFTILYHNITHLGVFKLLLTIFTYFLIKQVIVRKLFF